jgi:Flp pilus assembly protein CpaB
VKIIGVRKTPSGDKIPKVLMQYVRVAAVGNIGGQREKDETNAPGAHGAVTLEVTDQEAKILKRAQEDGPLSLSVISLKDLEQVELEDRYKPDKRKGEPDLPSSARLKPQDLVRVGYMAYTVANRPYGSGGSLAPGDRVKVIGFRMVRTAAGEKKKPFKLMKNIRVIAVDDVTEKNKEELAGVVGKTFTLEVTESEAKKLFESIKVDYLYLGMMSKSDLLDLADQSGHTFKTEEQLDNDREGEKLPDFGEEEKDTDKDKKDEPKARRPMGISIIQGPGSVIVPIDEANAAPTKPKK